MYFCFGKNAYTLFAYTWMVLQFCVVTKKGRAFFMRRLLSAHFLCPILSHSLQHNQIHQNGKSKAEKTQKKGKDMRKYPFPFSVWFYVFILYVHFFDSKDIAYGITNQKNCCLVVTGLSDGPYCGLSRTPAPTIYLIKFCAEKWMQNGKTEVGGGFIPLQPLA